jgi:hypothetical protein
MNEIEVRVKSLELVLQMLSVLTPENADEELRKASPGGNRQQNLIDIARHFELYIMGADNPYVAAPMK